MTAPLIHYLFEALPQPETRWTVENRIKWLRAAADIFGLVYRGDGEMLIEATAYPSPEEAAKSTEAAP